MARLRIDLAPEPNETILVLVFGIVVRPVNDWGTSGVVNHLSPNLNLISSLDRDPWSELDIVDDLHRAGGGLYVELFVRAVGVGSVEVGRSRCDGAGKLHLSGAGGVVSSGDVHLHSPFSYDAFTRSLLGNKTP